MVRSPKEYRGYTLAGCEAAYQLAIRGVPVRLFEMKPKKFSPAHSNKNFAELVCSNSLRSNSIENAVGILKKELEICGSLIMEAAYKTMLPAGSALAVDRDNFAEYITQKICSQNNIEIISEEVVKIDESAVNIIATGPLTSEGLQNGIQNLIGEDYLFFFDAAAPIINADSIDFDTAFYASRYDKGGKDYINCPMTREEYEVFYNELISAQTIKLHDFEEDFIQKNVFEACMPVEVMAKRGFEMLLFGPMKPVGLIDERTNARPFAVVQLRQDNDAKTMYNIVGFQTNLTFGEQKRVFSLIPSLKNCEILRYGVMHKNTFINSPKLLTNTYNLRKNPNIYFAGQITGVEGYIESVSSGFAAGIDCANKILGRQSVVFPKNTAIGALAHYISDESVKKFQPMNINFGIIEYPQEKIKGGKKAVKQRIAEKSFEFMQNLMKNT